MTAQNTRGATRPFAAVLAVAAVTAFWFPTLAAPARSQAPAVSAAVVAATPGAYVPALM